MRLPKLALLLGLCLIVAAIAPLPASAARACGCEFCQRVPAHVPCELEGARTTCGAFLIVALCPAQARAEQPATVSAQPGALQQEDKTAYLPAGEPESLVCQLEGK